MNIRFEEKPDFYYYGVKRSFTTIDGKNMIDIPKFWEEVIQDGTLSKIMRNSNSPSLGVCLPMDSKDTFDYVIGTFLENETMDFEVFHTRPQTYAIFEMTGPMKEQIQKTWAYIFQKFFPNNPYEHANGPEFEVYYDGDVTSQDYYMEIWIPVLKKDA